MEVARLVKNSRYRYIMVSRLYSWVKKQHEYSVGGQTTIFMECMCCMSVYTHQDSLVSIESLSVLQPLFCYAVDPGLPTVAVGDSDVSEDVPRVGLEEMLQEMTINDRRD